MSDALLTVRVYGSWQGLTAADGDVSSSFSNLRLAFSHPVVDGGPPGLTSPEELLLGAVVAAYCTAFMTIAEQMALDVAALAVEGELKRTWDEIEGNQIKAVHLQPRATLRTGLGFEKVHDMYRRAAALAPHRSPVLRALAPGVKITYDPTFGDVR